MDSLANFCAYSDARKKIESLDIGIAKKAAMRGVLWRFERQGAPCPDIEQLLTYGKNGLRNLKPEDLTSTECNGGQT